MIVLSSKRDTKTVLGSDRNDLGNGQEEDMIEIVSDVPASFGMWDKHRMFWAVSQRQSAADDGGGDGVASETDLAEAAKQLARIADAVEYMVSHWPTS